MIGFYKQLIKGLWEEIPVFRVVLGLCPVLAVTTSVENGIGMGLATMFVLICSNVAISTLRHLIPHKVRIPCYIVVAATFVTVTDLTMNAYLHPLHNQLGIFIPLIVVNCLILGRAEAFAGKNPVRLALADGIGMGMGFTLALIIVSAIREILGNGSISVWGNLGLSVKDFQPLLVFVLAPGGFITLGCLLGLINKIHELIARRQGRSFSPAQDLDCRHCIICKFGE